MTHRKRLRGAAFVWEGSTAIGESTLERQFQTELNQPRVARAADHAKRGGVIRRARLVELGGVGEVEDFRAEGHVPAFSPSPALEQREIELLGRRAFDDVLTGVSVAVLRRQGE